MNFHRTNILAAIRLVKKQKIPRNLLCVPSWSLQHLSVPEVTTSLTSSTVVVKLWYSFAYFGPFNCCVVYHCVGKVYVIFREMCVWIKLPSVFCTCLLVDMCSIFSWIHTQVELLGHKVSAHLTVLEIVKQVLKWLYTFAFPPAVYRSSTCSTSLATCGN